MRNEKYIWYNDSDNSRNPYAAFRKSFTLRDAAAVKAAEICIFADTAYMLYVNGQFAGFGPVRFDPRYPQYDCYNLSAFLRDGLNVMAILVNFQGHKTFKNIPARAALIAWGNVTDADTTTELGTGITSWKCLPQKAYARYTPKLSFALPARVFYDQAAFDEDWISPGYNDGAWPEAVVLADQQIFGSLTPREIPFMPLTPVMPDTIRIWPLNPAERLYSFDLPVPYTYATAFDPQEEYSKFLVWSSYIYSPDNQTVTAGILYEELWLNGKPCAKQEDAYLPLRFNAVLELEAGWNYIVGCINIYQDIYENYLSLPEGKGLILSADLDPDSGWSFRHTYIQPMDRDTEIRAIPLPWAEDYGCEAFGGWVYVSETEQAQSPCREVSWDAYGFETETPLTGLIGGRVFSKALHPDGFTLLIDMGHMRLLFPVLKLKGIGGATVDLLYGDRFAADGRHLRSLPWVPLGDRLVCAKDTIEWLPIQPRGFRYLNITVRNSPGDVTVEDISFLSAQYPVTRIGRFECADPVLTRVWEIGATAQSVNMEDAYDDCVDRERGLYALDTLIQYHVNLACFGDQALMKRSLALYAQSAHETGLFRCVYPNTGHYIIPDFCLYVVDAFYRYYLYTGDTDFIKQYWTPIMQNLSVFNRLSEERPDGLLNADPPKGDWPRNPVDNRTGFNGDRERTVNTGVNCLFSCLYLIALRGAACMAEVIGEDSDAMDLRRRSERLKNAVSRVFWDNEKGLFADNIEMNHFSPHASLLAVIAEAAGNEQCVIMKKTLPPLLAPFFKNGIDPADGYVFSAHYAFYLLDGLYSLGLYETAERCMREGWGYFLAQGLKTTSEHFDLSASQCHAWSAGPTYALSRYALGIRFDVSKDLDQVYIDIKSSSLSWARGVFPHPKGEIEVAWHIRQGRAIITKLSVPDGVTVHLTQESEETCRDECFECAK